MPERKRLVAGNWKMNGNRADGLALARGVAERAGGPHRCDLLVCPPFTLLAAVGEALAGSGVALGGQDCHPAPSGAFTGCISAEMLRDAGCSHAIVGHSERRHTCGETDADVRAKTEAAWRAGLVAIVCVGETRAEREAGRAREVVSAQIAGSIPDGADAGKLIVAYEPVWAIGTGLTPTTGRHRRNPRRDPRPRAGRHAHPVRRLGQSEKRRRDPGAGRRRWRAGRRRQPESRRFLGHRPGLRIKERNCGPDESRDPVVGARAGRSVPAFAPDCDVCVASAVSWKAYILP